VRQKGEKVLDRSGVGPAEIKVGKVDHAFDDFSFPVKRYVRHGPPANIVVTRQQRTSTYMFRSPPAIVESEVSRVDTGANRPTSAHNGNLFADGLTDVRGAAAFLCLSRSSLYSLMDAGALPYVKLGRARRIPRRALIEFAAARLRGGTVGSAP
jgi:excisionase family DNA binding protein